ncbi:hypothetical protein [Sulfitobacter dubius]|uniref:hypothetical protein n=1 Tax=Sulfitobacter dubius TaxID=218673 RepID=UPI0022B01417|nr:hypothetical protein [Sulfitobacter dubius]MCZ4368858.1 hypothetical protein [Sulfitobacter dubius]
MSDIIRFPQSNRPNALPTSGLVESEDMAENITMADFYGTPRDVDANRDDLLDSGSNISFLQHSGDFPPSTIGWSNQELADLYRTQRILALAGVTTEVDRGVSDEGDPWFVFIDSQGEVLVHFSRFDGSYLVSSPVQEKPIRGASLQDLVAEFSRRVQPVAQDGQNVVSIGKRNRDVVFIHPAAALAALVWSVYLMADELIAATPMLAAGTSEKSGPFSAEGEAAGEPNVQVDETTDLPIIAQKAIPLSTVSEMPKQGGGTSLSRESLNVGLSGHGVKAGGVSLSLIALAVGLPLPASIAFEATDENSALKKLSLEKISAALTQVKEKEAALLVASEAVELKQRQMDLADQLHEEEASGEVSIDVEAEASAMDNALPATHIVETKSVSPHVPELSPALMSREEGVVKTEKRVEDAQVSIGPTDPSDEESKEIDFLQSFDAAFENFEIANLDKIAQNELAQLLQAEEAQNIPGPSTSASSGFEFFEKDARTYLDFLLQTYSNVKIVNLATEIIFVHMDAFEESGGTHEIYAKSWSLGDGGTVSTIGFKADMMQFDLIA